MKGIIKLLSGTGRITVNSKIQYLKMRLTVKTIENNKINGYIPLSSVKLLKYFIIKKDNIIGEVELCNCANIKEGDTVTYECRNTLKKMKIGDEVTITSLNAKLFKQLSNSASDKISGTIVDIKGRNATIKVNGYDELIIVKRHCININSGNERVICKIIN